MVGRVAVGTEAEVKVAVERVEVMVEKRWGRGWRRGWGREWRRG